MNNSLDKKYLIKLRRLTIFKIILIVIALIGLLFLLFSLSFINITIKLIIVLVLLVIAAILVYFIYKSYSTRFKEVVIPILAKDIFIDAYYVADGNITKESINNLDMIERGNEVISTNYVRGSYKHNLVELSSITIADNTNFNEKEQRKVLFNGKWYMIGLKYGFVDDVLIIDKYSNLIKLSTYERIETKDNVFDNRYRILSNTSSQVLTFLTDEKRKMFIDFLDKVKCDVVFYFNKDKLHIGINSGQNVLKAPLFSKFDLEDYRNKMFEQLEDVIKFVDDLGLFVE